MNPHSLLASAAINVGLAVGVLSLFSVLKKQPSIVVIYYARRLSMRRIVSFSPALTISRLTPSFSWISRAIHASEEELLNSCGLDAVVVIRLFKFGIKFFLVCSMVGIVVILPINYSSVRHPAVNKASHTMGSFTISNIEKGSNWLWVHFSYLCFTSFYGMLMLYEEYKGVLERRINLLSIIRHRPDQFTVLVREIPSCTEHNTRSCSVDHFFSKHHPFTYKSCHIVYDVKQIEELVRQVISLAEEIDNLRQISACRDLGLWSTLSNILQRNAEKMETKEARLQELCYSIRYLQSENVLKQQELPVAFVFFKSRWGATVAAQTQQYVDPLLWITEVAPEPRDVLWNNLFISYRNLAWHRIGASIAMTVFTVFFATPVAAVQGIAKFERIKKWFPPARAVQLIPGLNSVLTGYLPSVILNGFIYLVPYVMLSLSGLQGFISISKKEMKTCSMVFYFLVGNVFFLSLLSGSLLDQIGEYFSHPRNFPSQLASGVSAQADFFITYILTDGLSGFSLEILQPGLLIWYLIRTHIFCKGPREKPYLYSMQYYRVIPFISLAILIGMVYAVIAPLLLPFLLVYFLLGYAVYINQLQDVYGTIYETCGQYWTCIHHYILVALVLMQITLMGLFGLKAKPAASFSTIPLLVATLLFNKYCKSRFLPAFKHNALQSAVERDELDEMEGLSETCPGSLINAYCQPCLKPLDLASHEGSTTQPLVSSS